MKATIAHLTDLVRQHDHAYYILNNPTISDQQYDAMFAKLVCLEAEYPEYTEPNSPTTRIGSNITNNFRKYPHPEPMLSIKSFYDLQSCTDAINRVSSNSTGMSVEAKLDGIAIELQYRDGHLFRALTRGNGTEGEDVTDNIRTIKSIPLVIASEAKQPVPNLVVRGEIVITEQGLKEVNKLRRKNKLEPYPNTRNAAASLVMLKSSGECAEAACQSLEGVFYTIVGAFSQSVAFAKLSRMGFLLPAFTTIESIDQLPDAISLLQAPCTTRNYPTDGIVIKLNIASSQQPAASGRNTPDAWALKERSETIQSPFRYIDYSISANGTITPIVQFRPVTHNGTIYKCAKVTWNNLCSLSLSKGATLQISIKGSVSAQITGVSLPPAPCSLPPAPCSLPPAPCSMPPAPCSLSQCPACKSELQIGNNSRRCINPLCPEKTGTFEHLLSEGYKLLVPKHYTYSLSILRYAAIDTNACIVRTSKGASKPAILYRSKNQIAQLGYLHGTLI